MRSISRILLLGSLFLSITAILKAQLNGTNLIEYQYGKLPGDTTNFSALYDRAVINYNYKRLKAGLTLEQFYTPYSERNYIKPTQYFLQYTSDPLEIRIGNLYETIGRGILLRSFEIPGAILEDNSYRSRSYFHRDIFGGSAKFMHNGFSAKALFGKPLNNLYPPSQEDSLRRTDQITALAAEYTVKKQTFGAAIMNLANPGGKTLYGMVTSSGILFPFLSYYAELAKNVSDYSFSDFSDQSSFAIYGSINVSMNNLGISAEFKNYKNILIGAGINEPPALVKEHSYRVLNRSTHVLQPLNETGYQIEVFYSFPDLSTLTLNNTIAVNDFNQIFVFREYFAGYDFSPGNMLDIKLFADFARDPLKDEDNRISAGAYLEWKILKGSSIRSEYEFQTFERSGVRVLNHLLSLGYAYGSKLILNLTGEISDDPFITESGFKFWPGVNAKFQINSMNNIQLFTGRRRGGPACSAGVCYEVLDFYGVEVRVTSRF